MHKKFFENIYKYLAITGLNDSGFERLCGLGPGSVSRWRTGKVSPNLRSIEKIVKGTGIPADKWIM